MSFPAYEEYRDTGVSWLGELPKHWQSGALCRIATRVVVGIAEAATHAYADTGITILRATNIRASRIIGEFLYVNEDYSDDRESKQLQGGDLVTVRTGNAGVTAIVPDELDGCQCFTMLITTLDSDSSAEFYCYWLNSLSAQSYFTLEGWGTAQVNISVPILKGLQVPMPPLDEQKAISSFLDVETSKIDGLVSEQRRLIELLKEKRQAVISHAVTKGLNPNAPMKPSGIQWLGDVPEHWEEYPLKALMSLKHGYAFDGAGFSPEGESILMTPGNFLERGGYRPKATEKYYEGDDIPAEYVLRSGQLLVAMTEQAPGLLGSALFVPDHGVFLHNQRIGLIVGLRRDMLNEKFLFHLFNSIRYRAEVSVTSTGSKVKHTSSQRMLSVKVCLPSLPEQEEIASVVDEKTELIDQLQAEAERAIELLQERRTALISAAVTGKIDVREFADQETA
jgi:type I restriction enzyme, S subunit